MARLLTVEEVIERLRAYPGYWRVEAKEVTSTDDFVPLVVIR